MNIVFKKVVTKNFMSFRELEFDFNSFCGQNVLIYGINDDIKGDSTRSNGSGKSTIMNTLVFALYGDILNSVKMGHIRNWNCSPKDEVLVSLTLESNGVEYAINRTLKGKKGDQELHVFRRSGEEWEEITRSTIAETQSMIETDIVLCGKDGFLRCVLLTADQNYNFFKLNKSAKNQFFESLFELTVYSDMYGRLHRKTLDETARQTASSRTIDSLNENILKLEEKREYERKNRDEVKEAQGLVDNAKSALEAYDREHDVAEETRRIDAEVAAKKAEHDGNISRRISEYDAEKGISTVDRDGNIVYGEEEVERASGAALAAFDSEHSIEVDDDGNIVFGETPEYARLVESGKELKSRIEKGESMVAEVEKSIMDDEKSARDCRNNIDNMMSSIKSMKLTLKTHSKITDLLCEDCLQKYKKSVNIQDFDSSIALLERQMATMKELAEVKDKEAEEKRPVLRKYKDGIDKLNKSLSEMRQKVADILAERKTLQRERDMCRKKAEDEVRMSFREKASARKLFTNAVRCEEMDAFRLFESKQNERKKTLVERRAALEKTLRDAEYRLKVLSENSDKNFDAPIKTLKESLEKTKAEFAGQTANLAHYKALEEILKPDNIRKSVVSDMLKELNFRICGYLSKMGSNYTCRFDEDFDASFVSSAGVETEYNNFSSGEKMRLSIACCLAFRDFMQVRLNLHPNILAIDEYIDSNLDPMAVNGIMDMIHYMVGTEKIAAFIISHRSEVMQDMFDSEVLIRKKDNESKVFVNGVPVETDKI